MKPEVVLPGNVTPRSEGGPLGSQVCVHMARLRVVERCKTSARASFPGFVSRAVVPVFGIRAVPIIVNPVGSPGVHV